MERGFRRGRNGEMIHEGEEMERIFEVRRWEEGRGEMGECI